MKGGPELEMFQIIHRSECTTVKFNMIQNSNISGDIYRPR